MIKLRANFIKSTDGSWHNIERATKFSITGRNEEYKIYMDVESARSANGCFTLAIGDLHDSREDAEEQLNAIMDTLDYGKEK